MKILVVSNHLPIPDRESGSVRLFRILSTLASVHEVRFCSTVKKPPRDDISAEQLRTYEGNLGALGITVEEDLYDALKKDALDLILFEFFFVADAFMDDARFLQPNAKVVVDTVDVHFRRLYAQAEISKEKKDRAKAKSVKQRELSVYRKADAIITVTDDDTIDLRAVLDGTPIVVIPNIHVLADATILDNQRHPETMLFVGGFRHEPNIDAVLYFCHEILPIVWERYPTASFTVIGDSPPPEVKALAAERVNILGYVPELQPYLDSHQISVAPLRFGAGMKGKIGEAMANGLPVVSTRVGAEGFKLVPGKDILVADAPNEFAEAVTKLMENSELRETIARNGYQFIHDNYSEKVVDRSIRALFSKIMSFPSKGLSNGTYIRKLLFSYWNNYIGWRLAKQ